MATLVKIHPDGKEEMKDGGSMCESIAWNDDDTFKETVGREPVIGCSIRVGTPFSRSYANQDWWLTTVVTKIVENTDEYCIFETKNSTYKLLK